MGFSSPAVSRATLACCPTPCPQTHSSAKREGAEAMALLDALIAALCGGDDAAPAGPAAAAPAGSGGAGGGGAGAAAAAAAASGALREVAARLLGEWLDWSARHTTAAGRGGGGAGGKAGGGDDSAARNFNATSLLRRLFDRLAHPAAETRLGAATGMVHCAR
jgi:hypothetical protein